MFTSCEIYSFLSGDEICVSPIKEGHSFVFLGQFCNRHEWDFNQYQSNPPLVNMVK